MSTHRIHTAFQFFIVLTFSVAFFDSCRKNPVAPIISSDSRAVITSADYARVNLTLVDYDVVHITHQLGPYLRSASVTSIAIGSKESTGFKLYTSFPDTFDSGANAFIIHFNFTVSMDRSLALAPLTIRYYSSDSSSVDVDTSVALYKYPYANAEIVADKTILPNHEGPFQDISRIGPVLYFHPNGPFGLYAHDFNTNTTRGLYDYGSGDMLAADSAYVFCDVDRDGAVWIDRYNTVTDTIDRSIRSTWDDNGLAVFNQCLYINDGFDGYLKRYTLDGSVLDSVNYVNIYNPNSYLAIRDSIAYSITDNLIPVEIARFDLRTKQYLPAMYSPAYLCEGITFFGDTLYYCDNQKYIVGAVPVKDLIVVGSNTK